jgi:hypothetical protein
MARGLERAVTRKALENLKKTEERYKGIHVWDEWVAKAKP